MKLTIEIDENALMERAKAEVEQAIIDELKDGWQSSMDGHTLKKAYKEMCREVVAANKEQLLDRIITTATISATRAAVKKLIKQMDTMGGKL